MTIDKVVSFAKENGYENVQPLKDWNGYRCYEPVVFEDAISFTGPPLIILVKDNTIRMSTPDEAFLYLDSIIVD